MKKIIAMVLALTLLPACGQTAENTEVETSNVSTQTLSGSAAGRNGEIKVEVTVTGDHIDEVVIVEQSETEGVADPALERIPTAIVEQQSILVDSVSGASITSDAIKEATKNALTDAGLDISKYEVVMESSDEKQTVTLETDVVVAGGGIAGLLAANTAASQGASVILVEKQASLGGSASLSSAFMTTVNNDNFGDDVDDSLEHTLDVLHGTHDLSVDQTYPVWDELTYVLNETSDTIDLMLSWGMTAEFTAKSTATTAWDGKGPGLVESLSEIAEDFGVEIYLETAATEIKMEDGAAVGLVAESNDTVYDITAKKVIITTGGAGQNLDMLEEYIPTIKDVNLAIQAASGDTGDGFVMMEEVGAQFYDGMKIMQGGVTYDETWRHSIEKRPGTTGLSFDADGQRYTNESPKTPQFLTQALIEHGSSAYYWLYDGSDEELVVSLEAGVEMGVVTKGSTIAEVAEQLGIDADTLQATYDRYQELAEKGEDEDFGKAEDKLVAYDDTTGFYVVEMYPVSYGTMGGVVTNNAGQVLDQNNEVIPNLFAAGAMTNRKFFSDYYIGGNSLSTSSTMGRLAAQEAVFEINE